jgi:radical SAM protein with 4Fe4S-binding SPASM domain
MTKSLKKLLKKVPVIDRNALGCRAIYDGIVGLVKGRRGAKAHILSTLSFLQGSAYIMGRPINITIEPTNVCNLKCPVCETGAGILQRRRQFMSLKEFQIIIDRIAPHTNTLLFYFMGEPFMNKHAYAMIRYAKSKGIPFITTCTNGDVVNPERLVNSGIDEVSFQIGGITQETHEKYRVGSKLDRVLANLKQTISLRERGGLNLRVVCGLILMKHNEQEIDRFKSLMSQFGVDEALIVDPCVRTLEQGKELLPSDEKHWFYDPEAFRQGHLRPRKVPNNGCPWIYYSMAILVNGDVVPCCRDATGEFVMGNILHQSLEQIWNGKKFRDFRARLNQNQGNISICRLCSGYGVSALQ